MISKDQLRKLNKEKLVNLAYDLLLLVDELKLQVAQLTNEVKKLREEIAILKKPKIVE